MPNKTNNSTNSAQKNIQTTPLQASKKTPSTKSANQQAQATASEISADMDDIRKRLLYLEKRVQDLENELVTVRHVNNILNREVDQLQQYQRRSCIVIDGINTEKEESIDRITKKARNVLIHNLKLDEKEVDSEMDKVHRVGKPKDGKQATILKFKSHSFRAKVYEKRKSIKNKKLKVRVSLTKKRSDLIKYAYSITEDKSLNLKFLFGDISTHGLNERKNCLRMK